jgi:hypothetical protein
MPADRYRNGPPAPATRPGGRRRTPLPERPVLTAPPDQRPAPAVGPRRRRGAAQPWLGLGGLLLTAVIFFAFAVGTGSTATGLLILGPISTFALAGAGMIGAGRGRLAVHLLAGP